MQALGLRRVRKSYVLAFVFLLAFISALYLDARRSLLRGQAATISNKFNKHRKSKSSSSDGKKKGSTGTLVFNYQSPAWETKGKSFELQKRHLENMGFPASNFVEANEETWNSFVFATVIGRFNFAECLALVASIQANFPKRKVVIYGFHLKQQQEMKVKATCSVEYQAFEFRNYPHHIRRTKFNGYKAIIIQELLSRYKGVFWVDSWVRVTMTEDTFKQHVYGTLAASGGVVQFLTSNHSVYAVSRPGMYDYLPSNKEKLKTVHMRSVGALLIYRTEPVYRQVFRWFLFCSLTAMCIAPAPIGPVCTPQILQQSSASFKFSTYTGCHEYEQSALGILLANQYDFQSSKYHFGDKPVVVKKKELKKNTYKVKFC